MHTFRLTELFNLAYHSDVIQAETLRNPKQLHDSMVKRRFDHALKQYSFPCGGLTVCEYNFVSKINSCRH